MKIGVIIQTRMGSSRLPGKVLLDLNGKTVLTRVIERVKRVKKINSIIIATTTNDIDDLIVSEAINNNVEFFRGSEDNVLERYYLAAKKFNLDIIIRITSDCPLIDFNILEKMVNKFIIEDLDFLSNTGSDDNLRHFARGLDVEIFKYKLLENANLNAFENYQREHVTPYIYENFKQTRYEEYEIDTADLRLTLDTIEDYELISKLYYLLDNGNNDFTIEDIYNQSLNDKTLFLLNNSIHQKAIK
jgi:spore coat polysaccharide biosynthesis protein SpsF